MASYENTLFETRNHMKKRNRISSITKILFTLATVIEIGSAASINCNGAERIDLTHRNDVIILPDSFVKCDKLQVLKITNRSDVVIQPELPSLIQKHLDILHLISCKITSIYKRTFSRLPAIRSISLENNAITFIDADAFQHNSALRLLYLKGNRISASNFRFHLNYLVFVDLSDNPYEFLNDNTGKPNYHHSYPLETLLCRNCRLSKLSGDTFQYLTHLKNIDLSSNNISEVPQDLLRYPHNKTLVIFSSNPLSEIRLRYEYSLAIHCSRCAISDIGSSLENVPNLYELDYSYNSISSISYRSIEHLSHLIKINLNGNKLLTFSAKIIRAMSALKDLCLDHNPIKVNTQLIEIYNKRQLRDSCTDTLEPFEERIPENDTSLNGIANCSNNNQSQFHLQNKNITYINPQYLQHCDHLKELNMSGNAQFDFMPHRPFLENSSLQKFSCDRCGITRVDTETFAQMPELRALSLKFNAIKSLARDIFKNNARIEELWLDGNQIRAFDYHLADEMPRLTMLSLSGNRNFTLDGRRIFIYHETIGTFECNGCGVKELTPITFDHMPNLTELRLSDNQIESIAIDTFAKNVRLKFLFLDGNNLAAFSSAIIQELDDLYILCLGSIPYVTENTGGPSRTVPIKRSDNCWRIESTPTIAGPPQSPAVPEFISTEVTPDGINTNLQAGDRPQVLENSKTKTNSSSSTNTNGKIILITISLVVICMYFSTGN